MGRGPDPAAAHSSAEFIELMRQLRRWADLSYRQLERNATDAGDVLPRATISAALGRDELPREELLAAYVRACGGDEDTVSAWVETRRRLSISGTGTPPPVPEDAPQTTAARADADTPQETPQGPKDTVGEEAFDEEQAPDTGPAGEPDSGRAGEPDSGRAGEPDSGRAGEPDSGPADGANSHPAGDSASPRRARANWRRHTPQVAIAALTVAGILALSFWPDDNGSDGNRADSAPTSVPSSSATPGADAESKQPSSSPTVSRSTTAEPAASPVEQEETIPSSDPTPTRTDVSVQMPAAGLTSIHPASAPSRCLTEGRERNGRTDREIAVQHSCADSPLPRVTLEKLGGQTYRIQWYNPDPGKGLGCLAVDGASSGALLAPRDCADSDSQKFRLEASAGGFRIRPLHSSLCIGFLPPIADGAEAVQISCTGTSDQAFTFTAH
ncbi:hypothetical protein ACFU6I_40360 [Streptomyces sp. NPDC057486]|uniref:hypothetical protein n=1 Tax=Streptomyces sp. NPDC057486 TaxID=3346145 RepID=UPI00368A05E4